MDGEPASTERTTRRGFGCVRLLQAAVLGVLVTPLLILIGLAVTYHQLHEHPEYVARAVVWGLGWPEDSIGLGGWDLHLRRARFELRGVRVRPPDPRAPTVLLARAEADLPDPWALLDQELALGDVILEGLDIAATHQTPAGPRRALKAEPWTLSASRVRLSDGAYSAPADDPMKPVSLASIEGQLGRVRWTPATRWIEGAGALGARQVQIGAISLQDLQLPTLTLTGTALSFHAGVFGYGDTTGMAWGTVSDLDERPAVEIRVMVEGDRVENAIRTATGQPSPVAGALTLNVVLRAGGDLPRGAARFSGWAQLTDAQFYLGKDLKFLPRLLVDIAPWFERDGQRWLDVGDLQGQASFGRGWVELVRLERPSSKHRPLQAWGSLVDNHIDLVVRAVPRKRRDKRTGFGMTVRGSLPNPQIRLARKDDLQDAPELINSVERRRRARAAPDKSRR